MVRARDSPRPEKLEGGRDAGNKGTRKVRAESKLGVTGTLVLTPHLRAKLKKPVGRLFTPTELHKEPFLGTIRTSPFVITVGDRVTETVKELGRTPDIQVVDGVERRVKRAPPEVDYVKLYKARNPAGVITRAAASAIQKAIRGKKPARVLIDGEEDLLTIPAIAGAPPGAVVYYGQPGQGVVVVVADDRSRASAMRLLRSMKFAK